LLGKVGNILSCYQYWPLQNKSATRMKTKT
jgi:hypothetical protein